MPISKIGAKSSGTIYDRSLGRYTELKRPLKAKESLEIERRRKMGESLNSILDDMRLLKK